ncbi:ABC transporter ATP-binding protein [Bacteroidia bacterium]|nr:ABC transporter ATP-binding protein [Bacteroidia bacterium]
MLSINQLSISFTGTTLFDKVSFIVEDKERIGLTGKNGAGKSTLLKIIAGKQESEKGAIVITEGHTVGYLPQEMLIQTDKSVFDETLEAFEEVNRLEYLIENITKEISDRNDYHSADYERLIVKLNDANDRFHIIGGQDKVSETEKILTGLGFQRSDFNRRVTEFSSGWQMRIELAKILLKKPNIMLLDEPTNHLDIESIQWLEGFLQNYYGAVILVSHDRTFLDNVTKRTIEIVLGKIEDYKVPYSEYEIQRAEKRETQINAFNNQQKEISDIEKFVDRFRYKATKARQVQSRIKHLNKLNRIEIDEMDSSTIHFKFLAAPYSGKIVLRVEELAKYYGEKLIFDDCNFTLERGNRIAFAGRNGEGKTTCVKCIMQQIDYQGNIQVGEQVKIGYFAQNQTTLLDGNLTVFQTVDNVAVGDVRTKLRDILAAFLFTGGDIDKKVKVLSGGEKMRLALAKLLLSPVNLLILDEPTNHLDLRSKDILKMALLKYDGTLIIVSHDRDFLAGLTDKVYEFKSHKVKEHIGDIANFIDEVKDNVKGVREEKGNIEVVVAKSEETKPSDKLENFKNFKNFNKEQRRQQNKIAQIEKKIIELEEKKSKMEQKMSESEKIEDSSLFYDYNLLLVELGEATEEWEKLID